MHVPAGTTLAQAAKLFKLQPPAGNLLDVNGKVLRHGVFAGALLLNHRAVSRSRHLHSGDQIEVVPGRNHTEPLARTLVPVPDGMPANPQFLLSRTPGVERVTRGAISHELVSVQFQPSTKQATLARAVALTFDDGPSPSTTPRILATLRRLHVRATFFVVGYLAEEYPQLVALERRDGMTIGNHTYNHPEVPPFARLPTRLIRDEIALGAASLAKIGVHPPLLRPPGGSVSPTVIDTAKALGERVVLWSVDPADWTPGITARQIIQRVREAIRPGSIVILHDGGGDRTATLKALPAIVKAIRHRGLRLVALSAH